VLAPVGDALAKTLGQTMPLGILLFARYATQALLLAPVIFSTKRTFQMQPRIRQLAWLRTVLHIIGIGAMFTALQFLPLTDAVAIVFVMPFIMLMLGHYVLGEEIGIHRIAACTIGFIGTLLAIQPAFDDVGWPALLPFFVAVVFSLFMLVTRQIAKETDPISLQCVNGFMAVAIMLPVLLVFSNNGIPQLDLRVPAPNEWLMLVSIGIIGTLAHLSMTWSLRFAPSATLAPMQYLEIPFATFIGWLIFMELPNTFASIGITITISAGLYIVMRERSLSRIVP